MKILVTGASGFLGWHIARIASESAFVVGTFCTRPDVPSGTQGLFLPLHRPEGICDLLRGVEFDILIHTAAIGRVLKCEEHPEQATRVNYEATAALADLCKRLGARMVFISTDQVFDGKRGKYREEDSPNPINHYGRLKRRAEAAVLKADAANLTVRIALLYGPGGGSSTPTSKWMIDSFKHSEPFVYFVDQVRSPSYVLNVAEAVWEAATRPLSGIIHIAGTDALTRYEFAIRVARAFGFRSHLANPGFMRDLPEADITPRDTSLDASRASGLLTVKLLSVDEGLRQWREGAPGEVV